MPTTYLLSSRQRSSHPYLSTDASGGVYVFGNTGFHQYLDASVVPEPSTTALIICGGILALAAMRHRRRVSDQLQENSSQTQSSVQDD